MSQVVIENPIINSPFSEPDRHFRFSDEGITNDIDEGRRSSSYFVPIAKSKKKGANQLQFDTEWTKDRIEENKLVNDIRQRVAMWRKDIRVAGSITATLESETALHGHCIAPAAAR
jgi:type III restriction enzyme